MITIIVPNKSKAAERFAAQELARILKKCTETKCTVIRDGEKFDFPAISIGKTSITTIDDCEVTEELLNEDGFIVRGNGKILAIRGAWERGTLYGSYDFTEKFLGVKYLAADYTYYPKKESFTLPITDYKEVPSFAIRNYRCYQTEHNPLFCSRRRVTPLYGKEIAKYGHALSYRCLDEGHNTLSIIRHDVYNETHPEFFGGTNKDDEICWLNGLDENYEYINDGGLSVVGLLIDFVKKTVLKHKHCNYVSIMQWDTFTESQGKRCLEVSKKYGSSAAPIILSLNAVCREVQKWSDKHLNGRKIKIITFAYIYSEKAPVIYGDNGEIRLFDEKIKAHENLIIQIAQAEANFAYEIYSDKQLYSCFYPDLRYDRMFKEWECVCKEIAIFGYESNGCERLFYFPNLQTYKNNLSYYKSIGVSIIDSLAQIYRYSGFQTDLKAYVFSKLLWNIEEDTEKLVREFCKYYYGIGAEDVLKMIELFENRIIYLKKTYGAEFSAGMHMNRYGKEVNADWYPVSFLNDAINIIKSAIDKVNAAVIPSREKKQLIKRLTSVLLTPERMKIYLGVEYAKNKEQWLKELKEFFAHCRIAGVEYLSTDANVDVIPETGIVYGGSIENNIKYYFGNEV